MNRELNPNLFGQSLAPGTQFEDDSPQLQDSAPVPGVPTPPRSAQAQAAGYFPLELKALEAQVQSSRTQIGSIEQKIGALGSQLQELARATNARLERFTAALKRLEEAQAHLHQDLGAKNAVLAGKVNERKVNDDKILDLIERHNVIVRNFENRLVSLQRTLSEQELQLHASNAALDEARVELARVRR